MFFEILLVTELKQIPNQFCIQFSFIRFGIFIEYRMSGSFFTPGYGFSKAKKVPNRPSLILKHSVKYVESCEKKSDIEMVSSFTSTNLFREVPTY